MDYSRQRGGGMNCDAQNQRIEENSSVQGGAEGMRVLLPDPLESSVIELSGE